MASGYIESLRRFRAFQAQQDLQTSSFLAGAWERSFGFVDEELLRLVQSMQSRGQTPSKLFQTQRYLDLVGQIEAQLQTYLNGSSRTIDDVRQQMGALGVVGAQDLIGHVSGGAAIFNKLPIKQVESLMASLDERNGPTRQLLDEAFPLASQALSDQILKQTALGHNPREIVRVAKQQGLSQSLNRVLMISRDQQLRAYRSASFEQYAESGVVSGVIRIAPKNTRTCAMCFAMDGDFYELTEEPPMHPQDRCSFIPEVRGRPRPQWEEGETWLARQPENVQTQVLGKARTRMFREGVRLGEMVRVSDHPIWGPTPGLLPLRDLRGSSRLSSPLPSLEASLEEFLRGSQFKEAVYTGGDSDKRDRLIRGEFDPLKAASNTWQGSATYFTTAEEVAARYGTPIKSYVNLKTPFRGTPEEIEEKIRSFGLQPPKIKLPDGTELEVRAWTSHGQQMSALRDAWLKAGYDGILMSSGNQTIVGVFNPESIRVVSSEGRLQAAPQAAPQLGHLVKVNLSSWDGIQGVIKEFHDNGSVTVQYKTKTGMYREERTKLTNVEVIKPSPESLPTGSKVWVNLKSWDGLRGTVKKYEGDRVLVAYKTKTGIVKEEWTKTENLWKRFPGWSKVGVPGNADEVIVPPGPKPPVKPKTEGVSVGDRVIVNLKSWNGIEGTLKKIEGNRAFIEYVTPTGIVKVESTKLSNLGAIDSKPTTKVVEAVVVSVPHGTPVTTTDRLLKLQKLGITEEMIPRLKYETRADWAERVTAEIEIRADARVARSQIEKEVIASMKVRQMNLSWVDQVKNLSTVKGRAALANSLRNRGEWLDTWSAPTQFELQKKIAGIFRGKADREDLRVHPSGSHDSELTSAMKVKLSKAVEWLQEALPKSSRVGYDLHLDAYREETRAYFSSGSINMSSRDGVNTYIHEIGHGVELHRGLGGLCKQFVLARHTDATGSDRERTLSSITGNRAYSPREVTRHDDFVEPYTGKTYNDSSTEVISMGLETLFKRPQEMVFVDPDYFEFLYLATHLDKFPEGGVQYTNLYSNPQHQATLNGAISGWYDD